MTGSAGEVKLSPGGTCGCVSPPHGSEPAADIIISLCGVGARFGLSAAEPAVSVCSVCSSHYGFSYIIILRPHA